MPKFISLYLVEIYLILTIIKGTIKSIVSSEKRNILIVYHNQVEKNFASILIFATFFKLSLLLITSIMIGALEAEKIAYEIKIFLYFYVFLFLQYNKIGRLIAQNIGKITILHFIISVVIIINKIRENSFQSLLWKSNEFGGRFVGFTGSSIGLEGLTLTGSTANSIGILYLLLLIYFQNKKAHYLLSIICILGIFLTFSQTAFLGLIGYLIVLFFKNINKYKYWVGLIVIITILSILENLMDFSVADRVFSNIERTIQTGKLPGTLFDRYLQLENVVHLINICPAGLFFGELYFLHSDCSDIFIVESYFFDQLQAFGVIGFLISFIQFFTFIYIINDRSQIKLYYFFGFWFISNLLLANTFETDFILLTLISLTACSRTGDHHEV